MNIFYVDDPISSFLQHCSNNRNPIPGVQVNTTPRMIMFSYVDGNKENRSFTFHTEEKSFSVRSNGHFIGKFSYEGDKILADWSNRLTKSENRVMMENIQEFFRKIQ